MGALFSGYLSCKELRERERERVRESVRERESWLIGLLFVFGFFGGFCCFIVAKKHKKENCFQSCVFSFWDLVGK